MKRQIYIKVCNLQIARLAVCGHFFSNIINYHHNFIIFLIFNKIFVVKEEFLHYLWKFRLFTSPLTTSDGEPIEVFSPGIHNHNGGPDFSDARIRIAGTVWAGNVEIHVNSSDWIKHGHQTDPVYDSVILHVVFNHDLKDPVNKMPVAEIKNCIDLRIYENYRAFMASRNWVPCINQIGQIEKSEIALWLERMLIERLEHKAEFIQDFLVTTENDWEGVFYLILGRSFGFNLNSLPFEMMARSLPYKILSKHHDNPMQTEALVFGQAGFLDQNLTDPWPQQLFAEYSFLRKKYGLVPVAAHLWKFMRLRPVNFPTIRLAQFAMLMGSHENLLSKVMECLDVAELTVLFDVTASGYWDTHYHFSKESIAGQKRLGASSAGLLVINAVLPFMFVYGRAMANDELCNRALSFYRQIPGELNIITKHWKDAGLDTSEAFFTQALIGLKSDYCDKLRCLDCRIGNLLLRSDSAPL